MAEQPTVMILAGPNGAGKSTLSSALFGDAGPIRHYVNADTIARGLSAFHSEEMAFEAGRIMLDHLKALASSRASFAFETTLATRAFATWIRQLKSAGYGFELFFLWLPSADMAINRVSDRVKQGGHHVDDETVRRRYHRGISNFFRLYRPLADQWKVFDNSQPSSPILIAEGNGTMERVLVAETWGAFQRAGSKTDDARSERD